MPAKGERVVSTDSTKKGSRSVRLSYCLGIVALSATLSANAALEIDKIYSPHMVLQQGRSIPVTGTCTGKEEVRVSFAGQTVRADVKNKKWRAVLAPMPPHAKGQTLSVTQGSDKLELEDIVVGEVWLASGQSNMLWRLDQTGDQSTLKSPGISDFRFFHSEPQVHTNAVVYTPALKEKLLKGEMFAGTWSVDTPNTRRRMSAVGYYFGKHLQHVLDTPVGVVHVSLGGSEMMAWMPPTVVKRSYRECAGSHWLESGYMSSWVRGRARKNTDGDPKAPHPYKPMYLYETGITPWRDFPIAGIIWYQGESDAEIQDQKQNKKLLSDLIKGWRTDFKTPSLPFIMVQLPRINDPTPLRAYW